MGIVTVYGSGYRDPATVYPVAVEHAEGRVRCINSLIPVANGDSANSLHYFGRIPSNAILLPQSLLTHGSITSLTDYDVGLYRNGTLVTLDGLANGLNLSSAGTKSPIASVALANLAKRIWELAGATIDPGGEYDIVGTIKADSGAASHIHAAILYAKP